MAQIIGSPTLDGALSALSKVVSDHEARGEKTLVFCEDKLTLLAERAVLMQRKGTLLCEVTTFARFLSGERVLSKEGSVMAISALIEEHQDSLKYFFPNSARAVYETLAQLFSSRIDSEMLKSCARDSEGALCGKLCDLAFLYEKYTQKLERLGLLDESGYLSLLPEKLASSSLFTTHVVFFGFPSFTKQAREGIRLARENALSLTGIFLAGEAALYTNEGARIFSKICQETGEPFKKIFGDPNMTEEGAHLAKGLFSPERLMLPPMRTEKIRRFTAKDEEEELFVVAALIKMHVAKGMRYRDFVVLTSGQRSLFVLEKVFRAYKIPFFAEKKRSFSGHPFSKFVLSALKAASGGPLPDDADELAANYYFGDGAEYRNYLLKFGGFRGAVKQQIKDQETAAGFDGEKLSSCRKLMLKILSLFPPKGTGKEYAGAVRALFELSNALQKTQELQEFFTGAEKDFLDLSPLGPILDEIELIAGERVFSAREFAKTLENGMKAHEISMIPSSLDVVFAGDLTDAKFARARVVFATGLTDEIPRTCPDTAVITDSEMERLRPLKMEIEPSVSQVNARARESLALNLCAFSDALYLSYPLKKEGEETARGEILQYAEALFKMPPMPDLFPYDCCEEEPAALKLLSLKNGFEAGRERETKHFSALYALFEERLGQSEAERLVFGREKERVPCAKDKSFSPTLLEKYFECPYAGFVRRALSLKEREERTVLDTDTGSFIHAVLEECAKNFNDFSSEEALRAFAKERAEALLKSPRYFSLLDTDAGRYTAKRLLLEAEEVAAAAFRTVAQSDFRVLGAESQVALSSLFVGGKADRIDRSGEYVRVVDYKTGSSDDSAAAYYTGRKLQLELYLRAAKGGGKAAGAFYFPARCEFSSEGAERWRMSGFFSAEDEVLRLMDKNLKENEKSFLFEGVRNGKFTDKGMKQEDFETFLDYSVLLVQKARGEIEEGNIAPSPYEKACLYCKLKGLCGFTGDERKEEDVKCAEIVSIVRRERGDE